VQEEITFVVLGQYFFVICNENKNFTQKNNYVILRYYLQTID